jgi:hypothetical protein
MKDIESRGLITVEYDSERGNYKVTPKL